MDNDPRLERLLQNIEDAVTPEQVELAKSKLEAYRQYSV